MKRRISLISKKMVEKLDHLKDEVVEWEEKGKQGQEVLVEDLEGEAICQT